MKNLILATIASLFATTAVAQEVICQPTADNRELHAEKGHELKVTGLLSNGTILEIWESPKGNFGVLISGPDGMTCQLLLGQFLEIAYPRPMKRPNL